MDEIIRAQRATVDEHIRRENGKNWPGVYDTFIQDESAFYDVVPFNVRYSGFSGVKDFYQRLTLLFRILTSRFGENTTCLGVPFERSPSLGPTKVTGAVSQGRADTCGGSWQAFFPSAQDSRRASYWPNESISITKPSCASSAARWMRPLWSIFNCLRQRLRNPPGDTRTGQYNVGKMFAPRGCERLSR